MRVKDINFSDILFNEKSYKSYEDILIYAVSYKTFMGSKPLCISFSEIDEFIRICDGIRFFLLFASQPYDVVYNRIRYLIIKKVVLQILAIIWLESELIHRILYL